MADSAQTKSVSPGSDVLGTLSHTYKTRFTRYESDRRLAEQRWLRNLRQYMGVYDPEIERQLQPNRSKAYPRITRVKCISVLSRLMNLMFPGNERNWALQPSPAPDLPQDVIEEAFTQFIQKQQEAGVQLQPTEDDLRKVVYTAAKERAERLSRQIDDYLQELGGDQTHDYIAINRQVVMSGVLYGMGVALGPYAREVTRKQWVLDEFGQPVRQETTQIKPQFEVVSVWDFYPDMSAKNLRSGEGYFVRRVMSKQQVKQLAKRHGFYTAAVEKYLKEDGKDGNYIERTVDNDLKSLGLKQNAETSKTATGRYEILTWYGPSLVSDLKKLKAFGTDTLSGVPDDDEVQSEVWMTGDRIIGALVSPWRQMGADVRTCHTFVFDEDDTSPVGNGLPYIMRDSQMAVCASARMLLDNASVVCGPITEMNLDLLRPDQDLTNIEAYRVLYREGSAADANVPAVRNINIDSHLEELLRVIELFMGFADAETFVGPATGGDMQRGPSEPFRTAAGASILRGEAALPFKDIVRSFDSFTQSVIYALVAFNKQLDHDPATEGDFNVVARGATSLISKEIRGVQIDQLAQTLRPEEAEHVDPRKMVAARFAARDLEDMLFSESEVKLAQESRRQAQAADADLQRKLVEATIRDTLASAFKDIAQGQKNTAATEKTRIDAVSATLEAFGGAGGESGNTAGTGDGTGVPAVARNQGSRDVVAAAGV